MMFTEPAWLRWLMTADHLVMVLLAVIAIGVLIWSFRDDDLG